MNPIRHFQHPLALFLAFLMVASSLSCYSRVLLNTSRLPKIQGIQGLEFVLIDSSTPMSSVWILSNPKFEQDGLSARFDRASEAFVGSIASIYSNADKRAAQNLVLIYISPSLAKSFPDTLSTRLDYKDISKIEVFEPDTAKAVGATVAVVAGIATATVIIALFVFIT